MNGGCLIEEEDTLADIEQQVLKDSLDVLTHQMLADIKMRANMKFPEGIKKEPSVAIDIDDILHPYRIAQGTKIHIKPVVVSDNPIYEGDFSKKEQSYMYFSKKRPSSVCVGDLLIAYAVGGRKIMGVYKVTSDPKWDEDGDPRWPWYVESVNLTPTLSNCNWLEANLWVTGIANHYAETYNKPVTHNGGMNLGALNYGSDKIRLDDEFGQYLLGKVMDVERKLKEGWGMKNEDKWLSNYEALKAYIDEHHHLPPKNAPLGAKYLLNKVLCGVQHNAQLSNQWFELTIFSTTIYQ